MSPEFALFLTPDGIALGHRQAAGHWALLGDTALDVPDLGTALSTLQEEYLRRGGGEKGAVLVLPDEQILFTTMTAPGPDQSTRLSQIQDGLDGLTPYPTEELAFDWRETGEGRVKLAVVARETLEEAAGFAREHGIRTVGFAANPDRARFPGIPGFDMARGAQIDGFEFGPDTWQPPVEPDEDPEADPEPESVTRTVTAPSSDPAPRPEPEPELSLTPPPTRETPATPVSERVPERRTPAPTPIRSGTRRVSVAPAEDAAPTPAATDRPAAPAPKAAPAALRPARDADPEPAPAAAMRRSSGAPEPAPVTRSASAAAARAVAQPARQTPQPDPDLPEATPDLPEADPDPTPTRPAIAAATPADIDEPDAPKPPRKGAAAPNRRLSVGAGSATPSQPGPPRAAQAPAALDFRKTKPKPPEKDKGSGLGRGWRAARAAMGAASRPARGANEGDTPTPADPQLAGNEAESPDQEQALQVPKGFGSRRGKAPRSETSGTLVSTRKTRFGVAAPDQATSGPGGDTVEPTPSRTAKPAKPTRRVGGGGAAETGRGPAAKDPALTRKAVATPEPGPEAKTGAKTGAEPEGAKPKRRGGLAGLLGFGRSGKRGTPPREALPEPNKEPASVGATVTRRGRTPSVPAMQTVPTLPAPSKPGASLNQLRQSIASGRKDGGTAAATPATDKAAGAGKPADDPATADAADAAPVADRAAGARTAKSAGTRTVKAGENPRVARTGTPPGAGTERPGAPPPPPPQPPQGLRRPAGLRTATAPMPAADAPVMGGLLSRRAPPPEAAGGSLKLGLAMTLVMLLILGLIAIWAAVFLPNSRIAGWLGMGNPEITLAPDVPLSITAPGGDGAPFADDPEAAPDIALLTPDEGPPNPLVPAAPELLPDIDAELDLGPVLPEPASRLPSAEDNASYYARNGIWQLPPEIGAMPDIDRSGDTMLAALDHEVMVQDAFAMPLPGDPLPADDLPAPVLSPVPADTVFVLDENGLVVPTPEGALTPEGVRIVAGAPPVVPVPREADQAPAPVVADDLTTALLAGFPPTPRPGDLTEQIERQTFGGLTREELAALRPTVRPTSVQQLAEEARAAVTAAAEDGAATEEGNVTEDGVVVDAEPAEIVDASALAVSSSRFPTLRPANIEALIERARDSDGAPAAPAVREASFTPDIPSSASVAREATEENAINLRELNLIGVTGAPGERRALVRLPSGRFVSLEVGDRIDGGQVAAIGETSLQYIKDGDNLTLELPSG